MPPSAKKLEQAALDRIRDAVKKQSRVLDLSNLGIEQVPASIGQLTQLTTLGLSGNRLTTLPEGLGQLTQLTALYLDDNQLTTFPEALGRLTQLTALGLDDNQLTTLPEALGQLTQLTTLSLSGNQLTTLPEALGQLTQLTALHLSGNQLTTLPDALAQLTQLRELNLDNSQLTTLPEAIGQLTRLQTLSLKSNRLASLPDALRRLTQLTTLHLNHNQLTTLPDALGRLTHLDYLDLIYNKLETLPEALGQLTQLKELHLSDNQLTTLRETLGQLTQLTTLNLSNNRLTNLPATLRQLGSLSHLFLHGNPGLRLAPEVLGPTYEQVVYEQKQPAKPKTILDYYFRQQQKSRPLNEVKLLLVGRGGAGKTSIVRALRGQPFSKGLRETKGITISRWHLPCRHAHINVNTWDFAGQVITHATHQFFLTQRSVYILVLTGREDSERTDAEYWLRLIQAFGTDRATNEPSPVIVALNKWASHPCRLDRNALNEKYPFIVDFVETDCQSGKGIARLKDTLAKTIGELPAVQEPFPSAWWAIKEQLEGIKEDYLNYSDYRTLCARFGESDESMQESLAAVLHALGVALNYADDPRLREATILNPQWVTNGVYTLLREAVRSDGTGEMHMRDVSRVFPKEKPQMRRYLVELMRRFDLAFPLTEAGDRWLVPQRLPDQQPKLNAEWRSSDVTRLRYRYAALPEGLLPRFITRTYPLSEGQPRWMTGVVLDDGSCRALVRGDPAEREVTVTVQGHPPDRRRMIGLIRTDLKRIHDDIQGLNPDEEIELEDKPGVYVKVQTLEADERNRQNSSAQTREGTVPVDTSRELNRVSAPIARDPNEWKATLFVSYSSKDARQLDELLVRLKPMVSEGLLAVWSDRCLIVGEKWDGRIREEVKAADVILFLLSAQFEASDYIQGVEVKHALEQAEAGQATLVSVILEKCNWERTPLAQYQVLPPKGKPVRDTAPQRNAWYAVAEGLRKALEAIRNSRRSKSPSAERIAQTGIPDDIKGHMVF